MKHFILVISLLIFYTTTFSQENHTEETLHQPIKSTEEARIFGKNIISTGMYERDAALSPDEKTFYFTVHFSRKIGIIAYSELKNGKWTTPKTASFSGNYRDIEPVFHPDGERLFFVSNRPAPKDEKAGDYNIWYVKREKNEWGKPVMLNETVNSEKNEFYPSFTNDGSVYFTAEYEDTRGGEDLYYCKYKNGSYSSPVNMGDSINSENGEYNSFISPDGSFIMYNTHGKGYKGGDIYIAFKNKNNTWGTPVNMSKAINSPYFEFCPSLSPDGKHLFFTSQRTEINSNQGSIPYNSLKKLHSQPKNSNGDIYIINAKIIQDLKEITTNP
jgi:Tol biopolymer transport system component